MNRSTILLRSRKFLLPVFALILLIAAIQFPEKTHAQENDSTTTGDDLQVVDTQTIPQNGTAYNSLATETNVIQETALESITTDKIVLMSTTSKRSQLTGWKYSRTDKYSSKLKHFTVGAIATTISAVVPWATVAWATSIANLAYQMNAKTVYYTVKVYFRYIKGTKLPRAEKDVVTVYSNSARTHKIGKSHTKITYTPGW